MKLESLKELINEVTPTLVCLNETHLDESEGIQLEGYKVYQCDRDIKGGWVLIAVKNVLGGLSVEVERSKEVAESLWIVISNKMVNLRVGVIYAPQESRTELRKYKLMYKNIKEQVKIAKEKNQVTLMVGDFNCKVGDAIKGNKEDVTKSGKLLLKLVDDQKLTILNNSPLCEGLWTRVEGDKRSVIDYVIISSEYEAKMKSMVIDEEKVYAPVNYVNGEPTYSDHNTILCNFDWKVQADVKTTKHRIITKKGYELISKDMEERKVSNIWKSDAPFTLKCDEWFRTIEEIRDSHTTTPKKVNKRRVIKLLMRARREIKLRKKVLRKEGKGQDNLAVQKEIRTLIYREKLMNEFISEETNKQHIQKIEKVVKTLKEKGGVNGPGIWEVIKGVEKKKKEPPSAILGEKGEIIEEPEKIKDRYKGYYEELLKLKVSETPEEQKQEDFINECFDNILTVSGSKSPILTTAEEIKTCQKMLKKKKCPDARGWKNELLLMGGEEMIESLKMMFQEMEREFTTPEQWEDLIIASIHKKGSRLEMENKRGLFITNTVSKLYERILLERNKDVIEKGTSIYQNGGRKGRSTADNILAISHTIDRNRLLGRKTYIFFGDAVKCFDKLWMKDGLVEMYKMGIPAHTIRMFYEINKKATAEVKTPLGPCAKFEMVDVVKQGTLIGPPLCSVTIDKINSIADTTVEMPVYMDDVAAVGAVADVRGGIANCRAMETTKKMTYGLKKSKYMVLKTGKEKEEKIEESVRSGVIGKIDEYKYLGLWISEEGNCILHINKNTSKLSQKVGAIKRLASNNTVGHVFLGIRIKLYESCVVPSLLYNIEAWGKLSRKEIEMLEQQQGKAIRSLCNLPKTTPYMGLLHELGMWTMEYRIRYRKLMLYHSIMSSRKERLGKVVIREQKELGDPNCFFNDTKKMAEEIGMSPQEIEGKMKSKLKKEIKVKTNKQMAERIKEEVKSSKKLRFIIGDGEKFGMQAYMSSADGELACQILKTRLNMQPVYANFRGDETKKKRCVHCDGAEDTTEHLITCPQINTDGQIGWEDLYDVENEERWKNLLIVIRTNLKSREA